MGTSRTDYLMWGTFIDPDQVSEMFDDLEKELFEEDGRRFDLVYDGMNGQYAVAGKIIAKSGQYDGLEFREVKPSELQWDIEAVTAVRRVFPRADKFTTYLFSHWH